MAQTWNALQQAQILSNQSPENSIGTMDSNGMPVESDESFAHEIEELIEKENFSSMMDLQDIDESDIKDLESGSLQHTCYESSWQDVMSSNDLEQDKPGDKGENNGNMIPCPLPNSVEVESILEAHSDKAILEPAFESNASLIEYSDISSCSDTDGNFDFNLSSSIDVNMDSNQAGQSSEEGDLNSSMHLSSSEVCHSIFEAGMSEINQQRDTGPPVTTGESNESVNHAGDDCSDGSLLTNAEVPCTEEQGLDNMNGAVPLSKDGQIEEREITDLEYFLDHCKELGTSQDGSNCASNHANIDSSLTSNGDENICPTIDSSVCQLERTAPDTENTLSKHEFEKTFVISGDGKGPLGDYQLDVMNPNPENTSSKPNFQETIQISGIGKDSLDGCQSESNQPGPESPSSEPDFQETIGVSGNGKKSLYGCQLKSKKHE
ncbi:uncharacterized protein LOC132157921, partial [Carassius carassius]|uniref:uncharacterized protein LOC132157921 n=1 Tax=Carassius carassius TaxID=217509 RepID=UPI00286876B8